VTTAKKKLFILNDDPDLVQAMEVVLAESGYNVVTSAHRNLDEVVNVKPDLVLVDVPPYEEKEGINFIQRMRLDKRTMDLPVLVGTTTLKYLETEVLRDKAIHVLVRPFDVPELLKAIEELLKSDELRG
jgi:DNA-binding response OmpR family regulator